MVSCLLCGVGSSSLRYFFGPETFPLFSLLLLSSDGSSVVLSILSKEIKLQVIHNWTEHSQYQQDRGAGLNHHERESLIASHVVACVTVVLLNREGPSEWNACEALHISLGIGRINGGKEFSGSNHERWGRNQIWGTVKRKKRDTIIGGVSATYLSKNCRCFMLVTWQYSTWDNFQGSCCVYLPLSTVVIQIDRVASTRHPTSPTKAPPKKEAI